MAAIGKQVDDVSGQIIGGDFGAAWVTYGGKKQGETCYPRNEAEAYSMCDAIKQRITDDCGASFNIIFPHPVWMYHFDGI